jgi:hypothetical protein
MWALIKGYGCPWLIDRAKFGRVLTLSALAGFEVEVWRREVGSATDIID